MRNSVLNYAQRIGVNPDSGKPLGRKGYEYLYQPLADLSPRIVIQKGAQVGATVMAVARTLWLIDQCHANCMYLFPTHRSAIRFSRGRFQVLLERSLYLRGLFRRVKNSAHMRAGTANFYCHGSRSRPDLLSTPVQCLTLDERDELYLGAASSRQPWSAVELARQRLSGQPHHWEMDLSTPTIPGHGIAADFAASDQHHFHVKCPFCAKFFHPTWPEAVIWKDNDPATAEFRCQPCGHGWDASARHQAVHNGKWVVHAPNKPVRGYHLSQLLSPATRASRLVGYWLECEANDQRKQVFFNSVLGLPYVTEGSRMELRFIEQAVTRGGDAMANLSQGSVLGMDVGPQWLHIVIAEPGVDCLRIVWAGKISEWRLVPDLLRRYQVRSYVVDAMPETHQVRDLVRQFPQGFMCYYRGPGTPAQVDRNDRVLKASRTDSLDAMYERWRLGKFVAPRGLPVDFADQLQSLVRVLRQQTDGQMRGVYVDNGGPDHYAHALNYCLLAWQLLPQPMRFEVTGRFC